MDNYQYIIASLPVPNKDIRPGDVSRSAELLAFIREHCSREDNALIDRLLDGYDESKLGQAFYETALSGSDRFIREFFTFDLRVRNAKVRFLNKALDRPVDQDIFLEPEGEFPEAEKIAAVLQDKDILARERGLDSLMWAKIDEILIFDTFNIDVILGFIAKLKISDRWLTLDEQTGREMFRRLVQEIRGTFKGVEFNE
ncbi:MAG: DUF2764 domain-containing protein [Bacteroidales bacterium]|nr:DUF2764 domain-containing protein [Bacteroidales bacterium]